jgi:hypothetical protein
MEMLYDQDLIESVVQLCASGRCKPIPSLQLHRFHAERVLVYGVLDPDEKTDRFNQHNLRWFREWGMEKFFAGAVDQLPLLGRHLHVMAFRKARRSGEEGAELYVHAAGKRHGVMGLRAESLDRERILHDYLARELMHLSDMVDPGFGYSPKLPDSGPAIFCERLVCDRYRLLWNISIEGRLARRESGDANRERSLRADFERAFSFWEEGRRTETFRTIWNDPSPRHETLMGISADPRDVASAHGSVPGAACPLCGFPTFDWASFATVHPRTVKAVRADYPNWKLADGACSRCIEIYDATSLEQPATLFIARGC